MTDLTKLWKGTFGDEYQQRNPFTQEEVENRYRFWDNCLKAIYMNSGAIPSSVLEVGAGQGQNLAAIQKFYHIIEKPVKLFATEVNDSAKKDIIENVQGVTIPNKITDALADLVFTYGVLIHTHPAHLKMLTKQIFNVSQRWIIAIEYFSPQTRAIPYRGENDALWLDDYGGHYLDNYPLRVLGYGFMWKRMTNLDNVMFWIMEKTGKMQ